MRIILINELYIEGGAEMQTFRECELLLKKGHLAKVITLDNRIKNGKLSNIHYNISRNYSKSRNNMQLIVQDNSIIYELKEIIDEFKPDLIHLNNVREHAISIYKVVRNYECVQTLRDYGAVCPHALSIWRDLTICSGYQNLYYCANKCATQNGGVAKNIFRWIAFKIRLYHQKKAVKQYIAPSQMLTDYCNNFGLNTVCINNPFDFSIADVLAPVDNKKWNGDKIFLYYGRVDNHKGIEYIIKAFNEFAKNKTDVKLQLIGTVPKEYQKRLDGLLKEYAKTSIEYLGKLEYSEMMKKLVNVHTVIIPSLWIENYPNTALEAMAMGCLAIASERGGMVEIIDDNKFVFNILEKENIIEKMEYVYNLSEQEYNKIIDNNITRVRKNNSLDKYYDRLNRELEICISEKKG